MTRNLGRREEKKLATRNLILDAAARLFPKMGYEQTSVDDIVKEADVVKGTFYYHFASKEEVLMALRRSNLASSHFEKSLELGVSPLKILQDILIEDARWTQNNRDLAEVFFTKVFAKLATEEQHGGDTTSGETQKNELVGGSTGNAGQDSELGGETGERSAAPPKRKGPPASIVRLVTAAQEAGELRKDQSADDLTEVILGSFVHAQLTWLITKSTDSLTDRVSRWLDIVLQGCGQKSKQDLAHSQS